MNNIASVTFVCTDNFTRSKIAEIYFDKYLVENELEHISAMLDEQLPYLKEHYGNYNIALYETQVWKKNINLLLILAPK